MPDIAIFIVDIQRDLADNPVTGIPSAATICDRAGKIIDAARKALQASDDRAQKSKYRLVFVQHEEPPGKGPLVRDTRPWELVFSHDNASAHEMLVSKTTRDTFESNPQLADELKSEGITKIVIFGIQSECCVLETAVGALAAGFDVTLLSGAHSTYDAKQNTALQLEKEVEHELQVKGAHIVLWSVYLQTLR